MSEFPSILREVCEDPDLDEPRLRYANCLEGSGQSDRAEFIRLQCADPDGEQFTIGARKVTDRWLGNTDGHPALIGDWPKTRRLVVTAIGFQDWEVFDTDIKRSQEMSSVTMGGVNMELFEVSRRQRLIYRRGFLHGIVLPTKVLYEHGYRLFQENPICHVEINKTPLRDMYLIRNLISPLPAEVRERIEHKLDSVASKVGISHGAAVRVISEECVHYWRRLVGLPSSLPSE